MDTGGLAQMTYNSSFNNGGPLGVPGSGFASRGKGSHIKRLSMPPQVATIDESQTSASVSTPRTSRSHLLAGLRTAPKSATVSSHHQQRSGLEGSRFSSSANPVYDRAPRTATGTGFSKHDFPSYQTTKLQQNLPHHSQQSSFHNRVAYTMPEQVLAPPVLEMAGGDLSQDESMYAELMSTNLFLAAQQQRLQQQLISVTAAAQQFQNLNIGLSQQQQQQQQEFPSMSHANLSFYQQQLQQGVQPTVQAVPGQPGIYCVFNPLTGQQSFVMDKNFQRDTSPLSQYDTQPHYDQVPQFRAQISPPAESAQAPMYFPQSTSLATGNSPPPPDSSANSLRRGHRKNLSFSPDRKTHIDTIKANAAPGLRPATLPPTPATGTFGPGQGRAGEHPMRQPRGPPSLEDLLAKPTSNHEGSKNFATRQRRRAVHNLVRAGIERRGDTRSFGYYSSGGTNTPASEKEFTFSDGDDATVRSGGSLSSKPSLGSLRAVANGAIGSERKEKSGRDRHHSPDSSLRGATPTSEDSYFGSKFVDGRMDYVPSPSGSGTSSPLVAAVVAGQGPPNQAPERRKTPMLVLSSAEKRKTSTPFM